MKYRQAGSTGLKVSEIGFGCGGNAGLMLRGDFNEQLAVVSRALDLGVTYFDNAPDYGDGLAEENLGKVLKEIGVRPVLNSKVEIRARDLDDIAGHVVRSTEATLRRLQVDYLDILQIHNGPVAGAAPLEGEYYATLGIEHFTTSRGVMEGLSRLVRDGKIRHAGFICRGDDIAPVRQLLDTGVFKVLNVCYTMLNPTPGMVCPEGLKVEKDGGGVLNFAHDAGCGTAIYSALARGFLTDASVDGFARHPLARSTENYGERAPELQRQAAQVQFVARELGVSLAQAAYLFVLGHTGVSTVLGGFSSRAQLEELTAVSDMEPIPASLLKRLEAMWRSNFAAVQS
jgi:aryl-alcohol dehydrogenase-like predicted oxidoreductase